MKKSGNLSYAPRIYIYKSHSKNKMNFPNRKQSFFLEINSDGSFNIQKIVSMTFFIYSFA